MMNKRLLITSTDLMMVQFLIPHVLCLHEAGYKIEIACSNVGGRLPEVESLLEGKVDAVYEIKLKRNPLSVKNVLGLQELLRLMKNHVYDIIWTNEPVMGVATRLAARQSRRTGTKVVYMAHGFHFFRGAPLFNWIVFFPIEYLMSFCTDYIVTINQEDYHRASGFCHSDARYIHGIGMNSARLVQTNSQLRDELGLTNSEIIIISVGELNKNKNQSVIIKALSRVNDSRIHYVLCGKGTEKKHLQMLAQKYNLAENVHFLGYRKDVVSLCRDADIFAMPSYREGLSVAAMEAKYLGLPLITSNRRGLSDLNVHGETGFLCSPNDVRGFAECINALVRDNEKRETMGKNNIESVKPFLLENVKKEVLQLFSSL